ncbi:TPA: hypothetical protein SL386_001696 [Pseudomonas aeruginosa]|nr:hypothetical protein [Pseudomonas aeruginosa]HEJ6312665.1 hypothetical protein [Pseudomonas aeruginosa]
MMGLGDNIFARAFIKNYPGAYLETPWPELYRDLDVKCVRPDTQLRTQAKNVQREHAWHAPAGGPQLRIAYGRDPIIQGLRNAYHCEPAEFDLPDFGSSPVEGRYVLVRPATVRTEWRADTRNPDPQYIASAAAEMRRRGYQVVSVADLEHGKEWALDPLPPADVRFHKGELLVEQLLALLQHADAVIGGIGWIVPAAIAAKVPAWIICGGQGGFNSPEHITDPVMDLSRIAFAVPDNFCRCTLKQHTCDKRIADHDARFAAWADRLPALV